MVGWYVDEGRLGEAEGVHVDRDRVDVCDDNLRVVTRVIVRCLQGWAHLCEHRSGLWAVGGLRECNLGVVEIIGCSWAGGP